MTPFLPFNATQTKQYGINIQLPPASGAAPPAAQRGAGSGTCATSWQNASACMIENFLSAALTRAWKTGARRPSVGPIYSWQNAIVVDPGDEKYHAFLLEQLTRHIVFEDAFAGIVIDRSDWQDQFNLNRDDGLTFLPELAAANASAGVVASLRVSYAAMIADLRAAMAAALAPPAAAARGGGAPLGAGIMLMNTIGNCRLDMLRHYDGQFSEGHAVSAVGLLGLRSPAILWLYNAGECCSTPAAAGAYFQTHLYLGVAPMAPFPGNDHAIPWDPTVATLFARYGPLFGALRARAWALLPHVVALHNASSTTFAKVNAFVAPLAAQPALLLAVMLGGDPSGRVGVNVSGWDRAWAAGAHPLLRGGGAAAPAAAAAYAIEVLVPGLGSAWGPLPGLPAFSCGAGGPACSAVLPVQLQEGCAMVRIRRA